MLLSIYKWETCARETNWFVWAHSPSSGRTYIQKATIQKNTLQKNIIKVPKFLNKCSILSFGRHYEILKEWGIHILYSGKNVSSTRIYVLSVLDLY